MNLVDQVKETIEHALPNAQVWVLDPMQDQTHLEAIVVSPCFEGLSKLNQQRKVMSSLKESFQSSLHALKLKTYTPSLWSKKNEENL